MRYRRSQESGQAAALLLATLAAVGVGLAVVGIGAGVAATHARADAAADLAALAGASHLVVGHDQVRACERAGSVAAANGAVQTRCRGEGGTLLVTVEVEAVLLGIPVLVSGSARAGPGPGA